MTTNFTTMHSIIRAKERCGLKSNQTAERNISLALQRGKYAEEYTSWERRYLENEAYDNCRAVAYNGFCYIVNDAGACVTIYALPIWFGKKKHFDGKTRIRDYKKYCNNHLAYHEKNMIVYH